MSDGNKTTKDKYLMNIAESLFDLDGFIGEFLVKAFEKIDNIRNLGEACTVLNLVDDKLLVKELNIRLDTIDDDLKYLSDHSETYKIMADVEATHEVDSGSSDNKERGVN